MPDLDIRAAHLYLMVRGFYADAIDGGLGPRTMAAIQAFQASVSLPQTGQLDTQTMSTLSLVPTSASNRPSMFRERGASPPGAPAPFEKPSLGLHPFTALPHPV